MDNQWFSETNNLDTFLSIIKLQWEQVVLNLKKINLDLQERFGAVNVQRLLSKHMSVFLQLNTLLVALSLGPFICKSVVLEV